MAVIEVCDICRKEISKSNGITLVLYPVSNNTLQY